METFITLIPLFFITACVYSSAGFAGGSTYIALLILFNVPFQAVPKIALICNLIVGTGGLYYYIKEGLFDWKRLLPFILASVPFAYLGGSLPVNKTLFLSLLGFSLGIAGLRLLFINQPLDLKKVPGLDLPWIANFGIGSVLGLLSGVVGIGGGIFLSPILYFLHWGNARQIAAASCFFIWINSISGLLGQFSKDGFLEGKELLLPLLLAVFLGGQIGSRLSVGRLSLMQIQMLCAVLILSVSVRILWNLL